MTRVAALYVDPKGVYAGLPDVDVWDEARDARLYDGPWPVVAHPPCQRWCQLAPLVQSVHGHRIGDDGGTFRAALESVRRFGGVLEHPAFSLAWVEFGLHEPHPGGGWTSSVCDPGWTAHVEQGRYGHAARKATWLYAIGVDLAPMKWGKTRSWDGATVSYIGYKRGDHETRKHLGHGDSSYTPPAFRDVLLSMARSAAKVPA